MRRVLRSLAMVVLAAPLAVMGLAACGASSDIWEEHPGPESDSGSDAWQDGATDADGGPDVSPTDAPYDVPRSDVYPYDSYPPDVSPYDVVPYDAPYDVYPYDAPYDVYPYDVYPYDVVPYDVYPFDVFPFDSGPDGPVDSGPPWDGGGPVVVATSEQPVNLALDGTYVYWENSGGTVVDCPLAGCPGNTPTLLAINGSAYTGYETLAVGAGLAFFFDPSSDIDTCIGGGCMNSPTVYDGSGFDGGFGYFQQLVTDSANAYFTDYSSIYACPLGSTCAAPTTLLTAGVNDYLSALYPSGGQIYYADYGEFRQTIRSISTAGGASQKICGGTVVGGVDTLVVAGGYVYFTTGYDSGSIYQCPASGGGSPTVYATDEAPYWLATDGTNVYWANYVAHGAVVACAAGASCTTPRTVAPDQDTPYAVAVSGTDVYWTTSTAIYRAAK